MEACAKGFKRLLLELGGRWLKVLAWCQFMETETMPSSGNDPATLGWQTLGVGCPRGFSELHPGVVVVVAQSPGHSPANGCGRRLVACRTAGD